jgi:hypothetical protein
VKLVADFDSDPVELAYLDRTIRNELPKSHMMRIIDQEGTCSSNKELVLPKDSIQLSFEIIRILDLKNEDRYEILGMRSAEERLKAALSLMETVCLILYCIKF